MRTALASLGCLLVCLGVLPTPRAVAEGPLTTDSPCRIVTDVLVTRADGTTTRGRITARPGRVGRFAATRSLRVIADYEAELACDHSGGFRPSAVGDPQMRTLLEGVVVEVRALVLPDRRIQLEAAAQVGRFDKRLQTRDTGARFLGVVDLPVFEGGRAEVTGLCGEGEALQVGGGEGPGAFEIRLTPHVQRVDGVSEEREDLGETGAVEGLAGSVPPPRTDAEIVLRVGEEVVGRARLPLLAGRVSSIRWGREHWLLLDADVEVG